MSCQEYQRQIVLSLYEELHEGERAGLETHLSECAGCRQAYEEQHVFYSTMAEDNSAWELPADLLVESRRALANELDTLERKRSWWRIPTFSVVFTPLRMLESATLIALGLAFGVYISNTQVAPGNATVGLDPSVVVDLSTVPQNARVSNVRILSADASTKTVEFTGDVVQPLRLTGHLEDATTRSLLFSAVQDSMNPGSRAQAVGVLASESSKPPVKQVLIHALLNDESLTVRLKALDGLKPYAGDEDVRTAFIQALRNDPNDGIRVAGVDVLAPFTNTETEMASRIEAVTRNDDNTYVRLKGQGLMQTVGNQK